MPRLSEFPAGDTLFIDANIVLEHLLHGEPTCTTLFQRVRDGEVRAVTSVIVLDEVRHRLLLTEAVRKGYATSAHRAFQTLRDHPELIRRLTECDAGLNWLFEIPLRIVSVTPAQFRIAQRLSIRYGLLTHDALHLAVIRAHRLKHLASADRDFRHVPQLNLWMP